MSVAVTFDNALKTLSLKKDASFYFLNESTDNIGDISIKFLLEEAIPYKPTAIYITRLKNQSPQPQIYIYDNTDNHLSDSKISKLHKELWSSAKVPLFFVFNRTEVKIFNSRKSPKSLESLSTLETINLASTAKKEIDKRKLFNSEMFDSGAFWEQDKYKNEFKFDNSVYNVLLDDLENLRDELVDSSNLSKQTVESLLVKSILVKYLDERGVFNQEANNFWTQFGGKSKFSELFDNSELIIKLFDTLKEHFNGGIFDISSEKKEIRNASLASFKDFLEADIEKTKNNNKQKTFWPKYSFKDLPIELISNIYELFLKTDDKDKNGIVYTPPLLVNFMIDEIMPIEDQKKNYKLIDPACGSGIFLVGAYKRLIQWWRIQNNFDTPSIKQAQAIIRDSIFGVDKEAGAIEVAYFSLSLALCDTFLPLEIWNELKFEDLREKNLLAKDFFEFIADDSMHQSYDLVIGNPPFVSQKKKWTEVAKKIDKEEPVPDAQLSFLFLKYSFKLLKKNAFLVMIQPSAFLYNYGVYEFRNKIFEEYKCHQVIDFTCLDTTLFKKSKKVKKRVNVAVAVSFLQNREPNIKKDTLLHVTVRQTLLAKEKIYFDLSYYDFHWLGYQDALEQKSIWKFNLMGGSRIGSIVNRLDQDSITLASYLEKNKAEKNWQYSEGYILGNKKNKTPWLHNHLALLPKAKPLTKNGIDWDKTYYIDEESFEAPRSKELFTAPLIIIREVLDKETILLDYSDKDVAFTNRFVGISAPISDKKELKEIVKNLKKYSKEYIFHIIATSSQVGVGMATAMLKSDIDRLPQPQGRSNHFRLSNIEKYFADDTIDYMMDFCKGKRDTPLLEPAEPIQISAYCDVYIHVLKSIYENINLLDVHTTNLYQITAFYFGEKPSKTLFDDKENITNSALALLVQNKEQSLSISRIVRIYEDNIIYIIKPRHYRFWLKSIAVRDADETFADLLDMGY